MMLVFFLVRIQVSVSNANYGIQVSTAVVIWLQIFIGFDDNCNLCNHAAVCLWVYLWCLWCKQGISWRKSWTDLIYTMWVCYIEHNICTDFDKGQMSNILCMTTTSSVCTVLCINTSDSDMHYYSLLVIVILPYEKNNTELTQWWLYVVISTADGAPSDIYHSNRRENSQTLQETPGTSGRRGALVWIQPSTPKMVSNDL